MMKRFIVVILFLLSISSLLVLTIAYADDADVLPKGVFRINIDGRFSNNVDERYNPDGDTEDVDIDYNTDLNSNIFSLLGLVEAGFGMIPGTASVGRSDVSFEYNFKVLELTLAYGITDKLTVGLFIPYWWVKNSIDAELNTSTATVGKSAIGTGFGAPLVPLAGGGPFGDAVPLTTEDVQDLLGKGLDVNGDGTIDTPGFGYKRFKTFSNNGVADIEAGFRYQYLKTDNWRLAFTGGVRIPTGEIDDIDMLQDYAIGTGAYALLFRLNNDYIGIKNLLLNATFRYDLYLPAKETLRVPDDVNRPITTDKEEVDRDIGDIFRLEASAKYSFPKGFSAFLTYWYEFKLKDDVSGNRGFNYQSLEDETDATEHVFLTGLSYSTVPLFLEKKFPVPLTASVYYRNRFAGTNNVFKSQYIGFGLDVYF